MYTVRRCQRGNEKPSIEEVKTIQWSKEKSTIYKALHIIKLKIEQHERHYKPGVNKGNNKITEHRAIFQRERQNS